MLVALVACSKRKLPHRAPARDLYQGTLFRRASAYAKQTCDAWRILSAKHGLVHPDTPLAPYDVYIGDFPARRRRQWARRVLEGLEAAGLMHCRCWTVLAGKKYRQFLVPGLPGDVWVPLEGLGIGQQIAWLNAVLEEPLPACRICKLAPATRPGELCPGCAWAITAKREGVLI